MKRCPRCNRIYSEDDLNFCLDDGELLQQYADEQPTRPLRDVAEPPTFVMDPPRATDPIAWQAGQNTGGPIGQWQGQAASFPQTQPQFYPMRVGQNQTLAIISICLGAASLTLGWCCHTGLLMGPAAIILGAISLTQIKKDPQQYGGRGLAIGGIAIGSLFLVLYVLAILIWGLATIGGVLSR
jgi:hypothetical protein